MHPVGVPSTRFGRLPAGLEFPDRVQESTPKGYDTCITGTQMLLCSVMSAVRRLPFANPASSVTSDPPASVLWSESDTCPVAHIALDNARETL